MRKLFSVLFRIVLKLAFIGLLIGRIFSAVWGRPVLDAFIPLFEILFGAIGACILSMLVRRYAPLQPPSLLLFAVEVVSVVGGYVLGRFVSSVLLQILFGVSMIVGVLGGIALLVLFVFSAGQTWILLTDTIRSMDSHERETLRRNLRGGYYLGDIEQYGTRSEIRSALEEVEKHY